MTVQLPYDPNPYPPGQAPIPVWVPHAPIVFPVGGFARVRWEPIRRPPRLFTPPSNSTFHLFRFLPPELRLRIWSFSAPYNRVIELRSWGNGRYCPVKISVHAHRLPTLFRVCKESRSEALRIYKLVDIGVSTAVKIDSRTYVPWKHHPHQSCRKSLSHSRHRSPSLCRTSPPPAQVRLSWEHDIIYLGPEFKLKHLHQFLSSSGAGQELSKVQRLALGHKLFAGSEYWRWDELRNSLFSLKSRQDFRELIIVPDDERHSLGDRWYYGKHEITLVYAEWRYKFRPSGGSEARGFAENLRDWFARLWRDEDWGMQVMNESQHGLSNVERSHRVIEEGGNHVEDDSSVNTLVAGDITGRQPPDISIMSVRRNGKKMEDFKDGLWGIQKAIGDMRVWKIWKPPPSLDTTS